MTEFKAAFFTNPASFTVAKCGSVLDRSGKNENILRIKLSSFDDLENQVDNVLRHDVETVFIEGGDGTVHGVLSELIGQCENTSSLPKIVLLSGGMTNLVAVNIGLKKPDVRKIDSLLNNPESATVTKLPLLKIQSGSHERPFFGFLLSSGAVPAATLYCLDKIHTKGISGNAAVRTTLLSVLLGRGPDREQIMTPTPLKLDAGNLHLSGDHLTSVATTLPKLMIGINPFWGTGDGPVRMTYAGPEVRHKVVNIARMFKKSQSQKAQAALKQGGFQSWNIDEAILEHDGPLVLDGEVLPDTKGPVTLSVSDPLAFLS